MNLPGGLPTLDLVAAAVFLACWFGFVILANFVEPRRASLISAMRTFRQHWIERMTERDNHVADAALLSNLLRGALFFAQTTVFILGGLVALLGTAPKVAEVISQLPYAAGTDQRLETVARPDAAAAERQGGPRRGEAAGTVDARPGGGGA